MSEQTYLDELSEERRHNLTASEQQLDLERDERIKAFAEANPELSKLLDVAISKIVIDDFMKRTTQTIRELQEFEIIAVCPIYRPSGDYSHSRILLRNVTTGRRTMICTHEASGDALLDSHIDGKIADEELHTTIGTTFEAMAINGAPDAGRKD